MAAEFTRSVWLFLNVVLKSVSMSPTLSNIHTLKGMSQVRRFLFFKIAQ
jgi:hypothetical protein